MKNLTELEAKILNAVDTNTDVDSMQGIGIDGLVEATGIDSKSIRGVLSSLVKKGEIVVEEFQLNGVDSTNYWTSADWAEL